MRVSEAEMTEIQRLARRERLSVAEWTRRALREGAAGAVSKEPEQKLRALRAVEGLDLPTADIRQRIAEIFRG